MTNLSNKTILVLDLGIFTEMAARLARDFGRVLYYVPWQESFPKSHKRWIGHDFDGVETVNKFMEWVDKVDVIFSPDVYNGDMVQFLRDRDYPVVGAGVAEKLENDREWARKFQAQRGLPTQKTAVVHGITRLREYLEENKDQVVKINIFRGDIETFPAKSLQNVNILLEQIAYEYGPAQEELMFLVEQKIGEIEPGFDGIVFDGEYLSPTMYGYELDPDVYLGKVVPYEDTPPAIKLVCDAFSPYFKSTKTRSFFSHEVRIDEKGEGYLIDMTMRHGAPGPAAVQSELIENYSQVLWGLGYGEPEPPKMKYKYGGALTLRSSWSDDHWLAVDFPRDMRQSVKFRRAAKFGRRYYSIPGRGSVCAVIALGNKVEDILEELKEKEAEIDFYGVDHPTISNEKILGQIKEGEKLGIPF